MKTRVQPHIADGNPDSPAVAIEAGGQLYTRKFFQVFGAAALFMTGLALQFHFGQYVEYIGYGVDTLGWILSISMVGTLYKV